jgi:hypothetical protein
MEGLVFVLLSPSQVLLSPSQAKRLCKLNIPMKTMHLLSLVWTELAQQENTVDVVQIID